MHFKVFLAFAIIAATVYQGHAGIVPPLAEIVPAQAKLVSAEVIDSLPPRGDASGCSKIDFLYEHGVKVASCYHNDKEKRDLVCNAYCNPGCQNMFDYGYFWGGTCYCCLC